MVFKLIRVDIEEPSKVQLQVGKHIIGRGNFLQIDATEKRVSKNHGELEVIDDSVTLKALHQNPCFYIKSSTVDTEILQQNNTIELRNGDKFGLLLDNFWYEVIQCSEQNIQENTMPCINQVENGVVKKEKDDEISDQSEVTSNIVDTEDTVNLQMNEELDNPDSRSDSPSLLDQNEKTQEYIPPSDAELNATNKRPSDSRPDDCKRLKTDPDTQDAGPSNYQAVQNSDNTDQKPSIDNIQGQKVSNDNIPDQKPNIGAPVSPPQQPAIQRERCIYGANCYRRNPQHKTQFSHPADGDWGAAERGVCPYGRACRKRDPRHWAAHAHPPPHLPPGDVLRQDFARRPGQGRDRNRNQNGGSTRVKRKPKRNVNSSGSEDDSEDSPETDLIVTGKRVRKNVQRDAWIDTQSDEDEDPYKTDESDEWQPSSDVTNSEGFSQNF